MPKDAQEGILKGMYLLEDGDAREYKVAAGKGKGHRGAEGFSHRELESYSGDFRNSEHEDEHESEDEDERESD